MKSAFAALAESGFEGLRLRDIAAEAGIDHSTVHHHFRTKEDLVAATIDYATGLFSVSLASDGPACVRMHDHFHTIAELIATEPRLFVVMNELRQHSLRHAATRATLEAQNGGWFAAVKDLFDDGVKEGCWVESLDPATTARLVMAVMQGVNQSATSAREILQQLESLLVDPRAPGSTDHVHDHHRARTRHGGNR